MTKTTEQKRPRMSFARNTQRVVKVPALHSTQVDSYADFLQLHVSPEKRINTGLQAAFLSAFPITSSSGIHRLEFVSYELMQPEFSLAECRVRGITYSAPLYANLRLVSSTDQASAKIFGGSVGDAALGTVREERVFITDLPIMTQTGSFLVNGTERVIISQVHRSAGAFFTRTTEKTPTGDTFMYAARIAPARGTWIEFEFDSRDRLWFRLDKRKRMPATLLLRAHGMSTEQILNTFYDVDTYRLTGSGAVVMDSKPQYGDVLPVDVTDVGGAVVLRANQKASERLVEKLEEADLDQIKFESDYVVGRILSHDVAVADTGEVLASANEELTEKHLRAFAAHGIHTFSCIRADQSGMWLSSTLAIEDDGEDRHSARTKIFSIMRPTDQRDEDAVDLFFTEIFGNVAYYDFTDVGRYKFNKRVYKAHTHVAATPKWFKKLIPARVPKGKRDHMGLDKRDVLCTLAILIEMRNGRVQPDDVDSLDTRRIRPVGELMQGQIRLGLQRAGGPIRDRLSRPGGANGATPDSLMNSRPVLQTVREFFASSQLSQFMDQTNPLSELTHKRRVSALGPGGVSKDTTSFEIRDVHTSHYGRLCPIETPEGPNIGLINSLALYARTNKYGFLETPYQRVRDSIVTEEIDYLSADGEQGFYIAQASSMRNAKGRLIEPRVQCRLNGEFCVVPREKVHYIDVAFEQVVSIAASTIPFLEHDDANRSLMGSNMLRQAVPCMVPEKPLVGTGMERVITRDSGNTLMATRAGVVEYVDSKRIIVHSGTTVDTYALTKRARSNQSTDLNQRPIVQKGDQVAVGDVIADGSASDLGELALGQNMLVAFMPWNGYNFEDSILISERVVADDRYTSIHIEELMVQVRDTNLGPDEVTRDVPSLGEHQLLHLDQYGIAHIGAKVKPGDVVVGKVTPKQDASSGSEEKLLRAIFGDKASDVSESCLRVPAGMEGTVIDVQIFTRNDEERGVRAQQLIDERVNEAHRQLNDARKILEKGVYSRAKEFLLTCKYKSPKTGRIIQITAELLEKMRKEQGTRAAWFKLPLSKTNKPTLAKFKAEIDGIRSVIGKRMKAREKSLRKGDELPNGVLKVIKVMVAVKRQLQAGDKMAGRHGNKGVVSRVCAVEDMPYLKDGTPVDVVLNPLGVPSRMNIGQVLEMHLGWAALGLGKRIGRILDKPSSAQEVVGKLDDLFERMHEISGAVNPFKRMSSEAMLDAAENMRKGVTLASPVFDGASEEQIRAMLKLAYPDKLAKRLGLIESRMQAMLTDGRTGEEFSRPVTVGVMNMLKLHHLVEDKMHARSTGPYSLVTQQPLGGKSQMGGQRVGEMEVWALEAYGAAHVLQEMLTVKSDDVRGREATYQNILNGEHLHEASMPESFNVLVQELRGLCLDITLETSTRKRPTLRSKPKSVPTQQPESQAEEIEE